MILEISYTEWIGYLASLILIISFTMKKVRNLRLVNSVGAVVFVVYGILLGPSWPIIITNTFILGFNLYYLFVKKNE